MAKNLSFPKLDFVANFLNSRNAREKYWLVAFFIALLFTADYFLWLGPVVHVSAALAPKIQPLKEELRSLEEDRKNKDQILKKWELAHQELKQKESWFVAPDETPALLEGLSKRAQKSGVRITSLEPNDESKSGSSKVLYVPLPIQMKASAGTHEFGAFLSQLESGTPLFRVRDLRITSNPLNEKKHNIELSMEAYKREKNI